MKLHACFTIGHKCFTNCMLSRLLPDYYCLSYHYCQLSPYQIHEPSIAIIVSASVVDRSIGTNNPHLERSQVDHGAFNIEMKLTLGCFGRHPIVI